MSSIIPGTAYQFIRDQMNGLHDLENDVLKVALFNTLATLDRRSIDTYSTTNECVGSGYTAGGVVVVATAIYTSGSLPWMDFTDAVWTSLDLGGSVSSQGVAGWLLYNTSKSNKVITVANVGPTIYLGYQDFTIQWPDPASINTAYLRGSA